MSKFKIIPNNNLNSKFLRNDFIGNGAIFSTAHYDANPDLDTNRNTLVFKFQMMSTNTRTVVNYAQIYSLTISNDPDFTNAATINITNWPTLSSPYDNTKIYICNLNPQYFLDSTVNTPYTIATPLSIGDTGYDPNLAGCFVVNNWPLSGNGGGAIVYAKAILADSVGVLGELPEGYGEFSYILWQSEPPSAPGVAKPKNLNVYYEYPFATPLNIAYQKIINNIDDLKDIVSYIKLTPLSVAGVTNGTDNITFSLWDDNNNKPGNLVLNNIKNVTYAELTSVYSSIVLDASAAQNIHYGNNYWVVITYTSVPVNANLYLGLLQQETLVTTFNSTLIPNAAWVGVSAAIGWTGKYCAWNFQSSEESASGVYGSGVSRYVGDIIETRLTNSVLCLYSTDDTNPAPLRTLGKLSKASPLNMIGYDYNPTINNYIVNSNQHNILKVPTTVTSTFGRAIYSAVYALTSDKPAFATQAVFTFNCDNTTGGNILFLIYHDGHNEPIDRLNLDERGVRLHIIPNQGVDVYSTYNNSSYKVKTLPLSVITAIKNGAVIDMYITPQSSASSKEIFGSGSNPYPWILVETYLTPLNNPTHSYLLNSELMPVFDTAFPWTLGSAIHAYVDNNSGVFNPLELSIAIGRHLLNVDMGDAYGDEQSNIQQLTNTTLGVNWQNVFPTLPAINPNAGWTYVKEIAGTGASASYTTSSTDISLVANPATTVNTLRSISELDSVYPTFSNHCSVNINLTSAYNNSGGTIYNDFYIAFSPAPVTTYSSGTITDIYRPMIARCIPNYSVIDEPFYRPTVAVIFSSTDKNIVLVERTTNNNIHSRIIGSYIPNISYTVELSGTPYPGSAQAPYVSVKVGNTSTIYRDLLTHPLSSQADGWGYYLGLGVLSQGKDISTTQTAIGFKDIIVQSLSVPNIYGNNDIKGVRHFVKGSLSKFNNNTWMGQKLLHAQTDLSDTLYPASDAIVGYNTATKVTTYDGSGSPIYTQTPGITFAQRIIGIPIDNFISHVVPTLLQLRLVAGNSANYDFLPYITIWGDGLDTNNYPHIKIANSALVDTHTQDPTNWTPLTKSSTCNLPMTSSEDQLSWTQTPGQNNLYSFIIASNPDNVNYFTLDKDSNGIGQPFWIQLTIPLGWYAGAANLLYNTGKTTEIFTDLYGNDLPGVNYDSVSGTYQAGSGWLIVEGLWHKLFVSYVHRHDNIVHNARLQMRCRADSHARFSGNPSNLSLDVAVDINSPNGSIYWPTITDTPAFKLNTNNSFRPYITALESVRATTLSAYALDKDSGILCFRVGRETGYGDIVFDPWQSWAAFIHNSGVLYTVYHNIANNIEATNNPPDDPAGGRRLWMQVMDACNNVSETLPITANVASAILVDTVPPTGGLSFINPSTGNRIQYQNTVNATVALDSHDRVSGVKDYRLRESGTTWGNWHPISAIDNLTLSNGDGPKTVEVQYRDYGNNYTPTQNLWQDISYLNNNNIVEYLPISLAKYTPIGSVQKVYSSVIKKTTYNSYTLQLVNNNSFASNTAFVAVSTNAGEVGRLLYISTNDIVTITVGGSPVSNYHIDAATGYIIFDTPVNNPTTYNINIVRERAQIYEWDGAQYNLLDDLSRYNEQAITSMCAAGNYLYLGAISGRIYKFDGTIVTDIVFTTTENGVPLPITSLIVHQFNHELLPYIYATTSSKPRLFRAPAARAFIPVLWTRVCSNVATGANYLNNSSGDITCAVSSLNTLFLGTNASKVLKYKRNLSNQLTNSEIETCAESILNPSDVNVSEETILPVACLTAYQDSLTNTTYILAGIADRPEIYVYSQNLQVLPLFSKEWSMQIFDAKFATNIGPWQYYNYIDGSTNATGVINIDTGININDDIYGVRNPINLIANTMLVYETGSDWEQVISNKNIYTFEAEIAVVQNGNTNFQIADGRYIINTYITTVSGVCTLNVVSGINNVTAIFNLPNTNIMRIRIGVENQNIKIWVMDNATPIIQQDNFLLLKTTDATIKIGRIDTVTTTNWDWSAIRYLTGRSVSPAKENILDFYIFTRFNSAGGVRVIFPYIDNNINPSSTICAITDGVYSMRRGDNPDTRAAQMFEYIPSADIWIPQVTNFPRLNDTNGDFTGEGVVRVLSALQYTDSNNLSLILAAVQYNSIVFQ